MKTLADLKVGDEVWTIQMGYTKIIEVSNHGEYPIRTLGNHSYTKDCKYSMHNEYPSIFLENPFEIMPKKIMCEWGFKHQEVECIVSSDKRVFVESGYSLSKEINLETLPKAIAEISLEQIAEKFGLDVEQIRIKP